MTPYSARSQLYRNARDFEEVLALRLDPIGAEVRVPFARVSDSRMQVDQAIDLVRSMVRSTRAMVAQALATAMFKGRAPKDFDWDKFEQSELEELIGQHAELTKHAANLERVRQNYRAFMQANGRDWQPIEKLGA